MTWLLLAAFRLVYGRKTVPKIRKVKTCRNHMPDNNSMYKSGTKDVTVFEEVRMI